MFVRSLFLLCCLFFLATFAEQPAKRQKRFAAFGSLSTVGGRVGCVVSQNKLFINGLFIKDLNEDEQQELNIYKDTQKQFKDKVHQYLEQRFNASNEDEIEQIQKPEPPKKPSFCSEKATTQYVFDGCLVQGDSVFIGNNFVRKLTVEEQEKLAEFDQKFNSYQEAINNQIRQRVEQTFGKTFGTLFSPMLGSSSSSKLNNTNGFSKQQSTELSEPKKEELPEQPKSPDFCTLII